MSAVYDDSLTLDFNTDPRDWNCADENWEDAGNGLLLIDQLTNNPIVGIAQDFSPSVTGTLNTAINIPITSSKYEAFHPGRYNQRYSYYTRNFFAITFTISTPETLEAFTLHMRCAQLLVTRYHIAEEIVGCDRLYTFKDGKIYDTTKCYTQYFWNSR